ncbi:hypothetical protein TFUB20_00578 [Tannerella forsythia]|uniref:Uncharacterized protein n=1 Tax=Tannerella forsythia TaxID=28112 RepID=A0A1D3UG03_TANFO|nr:hypothetical protein TFUB20_00578 [Tannerella forsythia]
MHMSEILLISVMLKQKMLKILHMAKIHKIPELYASCIKVKLTTNLLRQEHRATRAFCKFIAESTLYVSFNRIKSTII